MVKKIKYYFYYSIITFFDKKFMFFYHLTNFIDNFYSMCHEKMKENDPKVQRLIKKLNRNRK